MVASSVVDRTRLQHAGDATVVADRRGADRSARSTTIGLVLFVVVGAVLRIAWAGHYGLSFDESFTAMAGRRPVGGMLEYLRDVDSHPPLDALLRAPLARAGVGDLAFRAPSLVFSILALVLFARWMRDRGIAGVVSTAVFALSGFAVAYGAEARMYALLQLLGVAAAMTAEAWLRAPRRAHSVVIGVLVLAGCLDHTSMFLLAAGLVVVAGLRNDRAAWQWRGAVAAGGVAWAALWGASFLTQVRGQHSSWIPRTTPTGVLDAVVSMVTFTSGTTLVVAVAVAAGAVLLARSDPTRFRVWWTCGALPIALAAVLGIFSAFFLNRTLMLMVWVPIVAVGVAVEAVWRRWRPLGVAAVLVTVLVVWPGTGDLLRGTWEYDTTMARLEATARPGDVVAVVPSWYAPVVEWRVGVREPLGRITPVHVAGIPDEVTFRIDGAPATGRIVLLEYGVTRPDLSGFERCGSTWSYGDTRIRCLRAVVP